MRDQQVDTVKYPQVWGILINGEWLDELEFSEQSAIEELEKSKQDQKDVDEANGEIEQTDMSGWQAVRLIPQPEFERLLRDSIAAERIRLIQKIRDSESTVPFLLAKSAADFVHAKMIEVLKADDRNFPSVHNSKR